MALPSSGPISMSMVRTELELQNVTNFRLNGIELCAFTDLNNLSISQSNPDTPNIDTPNSASEWYGYDHKYKKTLNNNLSFNNILAPYGYPYSTFTTVDINETENLYINFTGSDFVNTGTAPNAAVSYSLYYSTYSLSLPSDKLIKKGVLKSTNDSDSFLYEYNSNSGSNVTWVWTDVTQEFTLDFEATYIKLTYNFDTGRDLDTRTRIMNSAAGQDDGASPNEYVGWSAAEWWPTAATMSENGQPMTGSNRPYLIWGDDNMGTGVETVLIDLDRYAEVTGQTSIKVDCRCWWYGTDDPSFADRGVGTTPVNLEARFYTGSYFSRNGEPTFDFTYYGATTPTLIDAYAKTIWANRFGTQNVSTRAQRIAVLNYDFATRKGFLDFRTDEAPGQNP